MSRCTVHLLGTHLSLLRSEDSALPSHVPHPPPAPQLELPLPLTSPPRKQGRVAWVTFCPILSGRVSVPEEELEAMLQEGKGPINFTVFLTLFGEKLNGEWPSRLNLLK